MRFNEKVHTLRRKLKMSQKQLAYITSMTQATISRIENGKVSNLRPSTLIRLSIALKVTVDYLIGKNDDMTIEDIFLSDANVRRFIECLKTMSQIQQNEIMRYTNYVAQLKENGATEK
jgi:transcriptional regulator with XRE-family HTH domain